MGGHLPFLTRKKNHEKEFEVEVREQMIQFSPLKTTQGQFHIVKTIAKI